MDYLLIQTILAARNSEGEDSIWMQILVLVILAGSFGIFSLAKAKANKLKEQNNQDHPQKPQYRRHWQIQPSFGHSESSPPASIAGSSVNKNKKTKPLFDFSTPTTIARAKPKRKLANKTKKDLHSGMELLDLNFLLSMVENTNGDDEKDITIRKLNFKELLRRGKLNETDSYALKVYAINKGNRYGKDIQCEAMKKLAERTATSKQ